MQTIRLHFAFFVCVCVCVIAAGSGCLKKFDRWRVGVEHEESSDENSYISFVHLHTHTQWELLVIMRFLCFCVCMRYLVEVYHEGAKAHRHGLSALHTRKDAVH